MLTPEQLHLFESYDRMFVTDGWKELVDDFKGRREAAVTAILDPGRYDSQAMLNHKAQVVIYDYIINLENNLKAARRLEEESYE